MVKKSTGAVVSKTSSTSGPAVTSTSSSANRTSILRSSFSPSYLQLHLFASVIQSFDSQQLRFHDVNTGRLRQSHSVRSGTFVTSLDWGHYGASYRENGQGNKKKRKRAHTSEDAVIAYGTSTSDICMYSPAEGRVISTLAGKHEGGVRDFKFSLDHDSEAWSIGGDSRLLQWDLSKDQPIRSVSLSDSAINIISPPSSQEPQILCASTTPYAISPSDGFSEQPFDSFKGQIHSLRRSGVDKTDLPELFLAADDDRYINIFSAAQNKLVRTLVAGSEVEHVDLFSADISAGSRDKQLLAVVTRVGLVELFPHPFKLSALTNGDLKSQRKSMTRKANAQIRLVSATGAHSKIFAASLQGPELVIVSIESGVEPCFQKIRWQDEGSGELLFSGVKEIVKIKNASTLNTAQMNGVKNMGKTHVDESRTVVVNGTSELTAQDAAIEISSEEEDEEEAGSDGDGDGDGDAQADGIIPKINETADESDLEVEETNALVLRTSPDADEDAEMKDADDQEPSFGEILASKHANMIVVADSFAPEKSSFDASKQLALPSGMSLGTVLTQALRTNDTNLLESCLHANDAGIIQNTIQRLDSALASILLSKLAERLASRPGRYGHLLSWVQWTCIAHGGAIAGQPDVAARIRTLYRVLTQRSQSLDKLLLLKGKLDMLDAQLALRKQVQAQRGMQIQDQGEPGMIYIEGERDNWSSDEDVDEAVGIAKKLKHKNRNRRALKDLLGDEATSEDDDDEMPTVNGQASMGSGEDDGSDEEAEGTQRRKGMYDVEAEVSGEDDSEDEEEEGDDVSCSDEDEAEDDDEEDSSMDEFINDGEISFASEDEVDLDDESEVRRPEKKKTKHR